MSSKAGKRNPRAAFGLFDITMVGKINRLLKAHSLRLKLKSNRKEWGDQVEVTVEPLEAHGDAARRKSDIIENVPRRPLDGFWRDRLEGERRQILSDIEESNRRLAEVEDLLEHGEPVHD